MEKNTYRDLALAILEVITDDKPRLSIDAFDKILQQHGESPTGAGRKGRGDWNYTRNLIRKNLNYILSQEHDVSLEVLSRSKTVGVQYHLVPLMKRVVRRPLEHGEQFKSRVFKHFAEIQRMISEEFPLPGNANLNDIKAWQEFAEKKAKLMQEDYNLNLRFVANARGLGEYLPPEAERLVEEQPKKLPRKRRNGA